MKKLLLVLVLFINSCGAPAAAQPPQAAFSPAPTETAAPAPILPSLISATLEATPTASATPTSLLLPSATPEELSFIRLRIEYTTTSDWSTLDFNDPSIIYSLRLSSTTGEPAHYRAGIERLELNQPLPDAEAGQRVGMTVEYALGLEALDRPLEFTLKKGAIGGSTVRFLRVRDGQAELLREISHQIVVQSDPGLNPLPFAIEPELLNQAVQRVVLEAQGRPPRQILAFYYPWYRLEDWNSEMLKDHPSQRYRSDDPAAMARHIDQAQQAGIDGFISSWWGPGDYTDQNLRRLLGLAQERGFSITIYFETIADVGGRSEEEILRWLRYAITEYGDHPAFLKVGGKPAIILWATAAVPLPTWQNVFSRLREEGLEALYLGMGYDMANLEAFDGLHEYGVFTIPNLAEVAFQTGRAVRTYHLLGESLLPKIWAATVQPGYDDELIPGREGLFQDRLGGEYYRSTWQAALASNPDWIFISTWNEWWEHTYIEPGELYGDLFLQITREFADLWKGK